MSQTTDTERTIYMWGEIHDDELVIDLVGFLHQSRRTAVLTVVHDNVRKSVYFRDGSAIAASSDQDEDRFGDIMFRRGMISREQLDGALDEVDPGKKKIGNVLLQRGHITTGDLWKVIKLQIEEILYSVLLFTEGKFTVAAYDPAQVPTRTAIDTQFVVLEGLRRKDELIHLQSQMPGASEVIARTGLTTNARLEGAEQRLLALVDGRRSVEQVFHDSGLGAFGATRALYRLMQLGIVAQATEVEPGEAGGGGTSVGAIISGYNHAYARIQTALEQAHAGGSYRGGFRTFFRDADEEVAALFEDITPGPDGRVSSQRLMTNLKVSKARDKLFILRRGLGDYLRFMLFVAREALPFDRVEGLASEVRDLVRGL